MAYLTLTSEKRRPAIDGPPVRTAAPRTVGPASLTPDDPERKIGRRFSRLPEEQFPRRDAAPPEAERLHSKGERTQSENGLKASRLNR